MKRFLTFVGAVVVATLLVWLAGRACFKPTQHYEEDAVWPYGLGKLRDLPKRYPSHEANTNAVEVTRLAADLDVSLNQTEANRRQGESRVLSLRPSIRTYLTTNIESAGDTVVAPPAEVAAFLAEHDGALAALRAQLNANAPPRWTADIQELVDPPRPHLVGHTSLFGLFAADAVDRHRQGDDATAWRDLDAIWKLGRSLMAMPDFASISSAVYAAQLTTGIAAKLRSPTPLWWHTFVDTDFERTIAAAYQYQAWRNLTFTRRYPAGEPSDDGPFREALRRGAEIVVGPFRVEHAERSAAAMRERTVRFEHLPTCASGGDPFVSLDYLWIRERRYSIEQEGVSRLLALKESRLAANDWPPSWPGIERSRCAGHSWSYTRASDGSMRLALTPPLPLRTERDTRLALPLEFREPR